ncbi:MAG: hypothetical protein AAF202_08955, partial [Pseudomonadota bacterium]
MVSLILATLMLTCFHASALDLTPVLKALQTAGTVPESGQTVELLEGLGQLRTELLDYSASGAPDLSADLSTADAVLLLTQVNRLMAYYEDIHSFNSAGRADLIFFADWLFGQQVSIRKALISDFRAHFKKREHNPAFEWMFFQQIWRPLISTPDGQMSRSWTDVMKVALDEWIPLTAEALSRASRRDAELKTLIMEGLIENAKNPANLLLFATESLQIAIQTQPLPIEDRELYRILQETLRRHNVILKDPQLVETLESAFSEDTRAQHLDDGLPRVFDRILAEEGMSNENLQTLDEALRQRSEQSRAAAIYESVVTFQSLSPLVPRNELREALGPAIVLLRRMRQPQGPASLVVGSSTDTSFQTLYQLQGMALNPSLHKKIQRLALKLMSTLAIEMNRASMLNLSQKESLSDIIRLMRYEHPANIDVAKLCQHVVETSDWPMIGLSEAYAYLEESKL